MATVVMAASQMDYSPKRKRASADSIPQGPQSPALLPRLSTEVDEIHSQPIETGSPRSVVAGHLQHLDISGPWVQRLSFNDAGRARKRFAQMSPEPESHLQHQTESQPRFGDHSTVINLPRLLPYTGQSSDEALHPDIEGFATSQINARPRAQSKSPPLNDKVDDNPLTWHESEITGHNPSDPNDDGYGMNGIGFRPTASLAWSRSQRRKQQIAEYRSREAKEARQRRSERRRNISIDVKDDGGVKTDVKNVPRVRFDEASVMDES